tara:strand:+ start:3225 stop:3545 length:321 start_codon:yes stop_codon:yes gene_type:complete
MCGMCLEHCPTYAISKNEAESPRGRISMISAINRGDLEVNMKSLTHINNCILCLSCQKACPANVNFKEIIGSFKKDKLQTLSFLEKITLFIKRSHVFARVLFGKLI